MQLSATAKSLIKYALALVLLVFILRHAGIERISGYLRQISWLNLLVALVLATLSQFASALRMRFFFTKSGFLINRKFAIILYYVGAFYNFLLPGGIGGDAYKVILARKRLDVSAAQGIRIMLADRASGLCILMLLLFATLYYIDFTHTIAFANLLIVAAVIITLAGYILFSRWLLKQSAATMLGSLPYSVAVQSLWAATLLMLWASIGKGIHAIEYVGLYAAASITGMLPISVGGLGIKEMTYYYGASLMQRYAGDTVDPDLGVALSLCLFALGFITALPGLLWLDKVTKAEHQ